MGEEQRVKILLIGNLWKSYHQITNECKIRDALRHIGHTVYAYNWNKGSTKELRAYDYIFEDKPRVDFCLVAKGITAEQIWALRVATGAPVFYWCFDVMSKGWPTEKLLRNKHWQAAKAADGYFGRSWGMGLKFREIGIRHFYLNEDAAANMFDKVDIDLPGRAATAERTRLKQREYPVIFTGTYYRTGVNRPQLLLGIQEKIAPVPLHIFSYNPKTWQEFGFSLAHGGKWDGSLRHLIARAKIVLAIDVRHDMPGYWSDRITESQACGGFVLSKFTVGMEQNFGPDKDRLVYWDTTDDCAAKIKYYLGHENERREIAERGYQYAKKYMTFENKVRQLLTILRYKYGIKGS